MLKTVTSLLLAAVILAGCAEKGKESSTREVEQAVYFNEGPTRLTLITMVNNRSGAGAHSALLVESSQSVLFDPAGSFEHELLPERGDVLYGLTPVWVDRYISAHARSQFHVVRQEIDVTPAQAARALQLVQARGPVPSAFCTNATSGVLKQIPGFEGISQSFFPLNLMEQFEQLPGVRTTRVYEDDDGGVRDGVANLGN